MSPKETARLLFDSMNAQNLKMLGPLLAPFSELHFPHSEVFVGPERILWFLKKLFGKYPVLKFKTGRIIADARSAAVEWSNKGQTKSGKPYANAGVTVIEIEKGQIVYLSYTFNDTTVFRSPSHLQGSSEMTQPFKIKK